MMYPIEMYFFFGWQPIFLQWPPQHYGMAGHRGGWCGLFPEKFPATWNGSL